jgi:hypothetical protein
MSQLQPHQQRVVDERRELDTKIEALSVFIRANPVFLNLDAAEQARLKYQSAAMADYSYILGERIGAFK